MMWRRPSITLTAKASCAAGVCAFLLAAATVDSQEPEQPLFRSQSDLVVLHVNVFDRRSDAVPDLPESAFLVIEDDKPQEIAFFASGDVPVAAGLVIDNSGSMITRRSMVLAGTRTFAEASHPEDEMFAVVFNENVRLGLPAGVGFTRSASQLTTSFTRLPAGGKTALYDAVIAALDHLETASHQKRVLVVLSDGGDNASVHRKQEMFDKVSASDAIVYTIMNNVRAYDDDPDAMKRLAELSGGLAYAPKNEQDVIEDFGEIAGNIRRGYSIGYVPPTSESEKYHKVKVLVRVPGRTNLTARVRHGYIHRSSVEP